jgi:PAS domain S-box-containing protein
LYDGIYIADGTGKTIFVNKAYLRNTEIPMGKLIGRTVKEITEEGLYKGAVTMEVLERKEPVNSLGKILGNNKEVLVSGSPIFDEEGNVKLVVINNRDISDLKELEKINAKLNKDKKRAYEEINYLRKQQISNHIVGDQTNETMELVNTISPTDVTVLITGESGTGKEVVADEIYHRSKRNNKPFIKVNCAAIPGELLEAELFGYEGGAFTDARKAGKIGLFELANEGTILLDEIGEMQLSLQSKLLRVLQTKEIRRIGGNKSIMLDIRVIASTNKDLQEEIRKGTFREDLYYRLNVVPISIKPLRERKEMIPDLTKEFLDKYNKKYGKDAIIQEEAIYLLTEYKWPGNIRELENLIERMVVINNDGIIKYNSIASILELESIEDSEYDTRTLKDIVERLERDVITRTIKKYGSVNKSAAVLGLSQPALWKKCKKLNIE